jgi:hypothetical protein
MSIIQTLFFVQLLFFTYVCVFAIWFVRKYINNAAAYFVEILHLFVQLHFIW